MSIGFLVCLVIGYLWGSFVTYRLWRERNK